METPDCSKMVATAGVRQLISLGRIVEMGSGAPLSPTFDKKTAAASAKL